MTIEMKQIAPILLLIILVCSCKSKQPEFSQGIHPLHKVITDFAHVFTEEEEIQLNDLIKKSNDASDIEIIVLTVNDIEPYSHIKEYALETGNQNGIGDKEKNNGVLIVMSLHLREIYIATGSGINHRLTDEELKKIIDELIIPKFRNGYYFEGVNIAIKEISSKSTH